MTVSMKISLLIMAFLLMGLSVDVAAEDTDNSQVFNLGEVVVTGKADAVTQIATVETMDKALLDLTNSVNVSEALDTLPGVAASIGRRNEAVVNVRGFNQKYVPIFFDGIPWYVPNDGYVDPSEISTGTISRITLTKGAASTLYGANTLGGVINIITMKPREKFEGIYNFTLDTNGYSGSLNLGSRIDKFYFMAGFSGFDFDDFRMSDDFSPVPVEGAWFENNGDRDNSEADSTTMSFKAGFMPADGHEYAIGYHRTNSEKGLPPNIYPSERQRYWRFTDWEKTTYYFIGDSKISDELSLKTRIYHDEYYNVLDSYDDSTYTTQTRRSAFHSTYDDHTDGGSLVLRTGYIDNNVVSFSYHLKNDVHKEQDNYGVAWEKYEAQTSSYGIEDAVNINENLDIVLGVNYDVQKAKYNNNNPTRDDDNSWNGLIGLTYYYQDATKLHVSIAGKTRFPTLKELYSSFLGTAVPNPNLKKEQAVNYEIGISKPLPGESNIGITLFYSDVKDKIEERTVMLDGEELDFNDNIGKSRFQGIELTFMTNSVPNNSIYLSYTYVDAKNQTPGRTSDLMSETPKHQLYISDTIQITKRFSLFGKARYDNGQKEDTRTFGWIELDDYWLFDLKGIMDLSENFQVEAGVRNIFDENYQTGFGFPREGRTFFCGIRGSF